MDLQARLLAGMMSGKLSVDNEKLLSALETNKLIRNTRPRAQFPRFDYTGKTILLSLYFTFTIFTQLTLLRQFKKVTWTR
jgi:hypothetical protein